MPTSRDRLNKNAVLSNEKSPNIENIGIARLTFNSNEIADPNIAQSILKNFAKSMQSLADENDFALIKSSYNKVTKEYYALVKTMAEQERVLELAKNLKTSYQSKINADFDFEYTNNGIVGFDEEGNTRKSRINNVQQFHGRYVTFTNSASKRMAREIIKQQGWEIEGETDNRFYYGGLAYLDDNGLSQKGVYNTAKAFNAVYKENAREHARIAQAKKEEYDKQVAEGLAEWEAKEKKEEEERIKRLAQQEEEDRKKETKWIEIENKSKREETKKAEKEEARKKEREEKEKEREEAQNKKQVHTIIGKILKVLTTISALLLGLGKATASVVADAVNATLGSIGLGIGARDYKKYQIMSQTVGLDKDTLVNGMHDLQTKFGNVDKLDNNAIYSLAPALRDYIAPLITSGIYKDRMDDLTAVILDKYMGLYKQGKNHLGEYVGKEKAGAELTTSLGMVSGNLSQVLSGMIAYGYDTFDAFKKGTLSPQSTNIQYEYLTEVGKSLNELKTSLDNIKVAIFSPLASDIKAIAGWVSRIANKYSKDEISKAERLTINRKQNAETIAKLSAVLEGKQDFINRIDSKNYVWRDGSKLTYDKLAFLYEGEYINGGDVYKLLGAKNTQQFFAYYYADKMLKEANKKEKKYYSYGKDENPSTMNEYNAFVENAVLDYARNSNPRIHKEVPYSLDDKGNLVWNTNSAIYQRYKGIIESTNRTAQQKGINRISDEEEKLIMTTWLNAKDVGGKERVKLVEALIPALEILHYNNTALDSQKVFNGVYNFLMGSNVNGGRQLNLWDTKQLTSLFTHSGVASVIKNLDTVYQPNKDNTAEIITALLERNVSFNKERDGNIYLTVNLDGKEIKATIPIDNEIRQYMNGS